MQLYEQGLLGGEGGSLHFENEYIVAFGVLFAEQLQSIHQNVLKSCMFLKI